MTRGLWALQEEADGGLVTHRVQLEPDGSFKPLCGTSARLVTLLPGGPYRMTGCEVCEGLVKVEG